MKYIAIRIIKQMFADKRSLGIIFVVPILMLILLYLLLGNSNYQPIVAYRGLPARVVTLLERQPIRLIPLEETIDIVDFLKQKRADAVITMGTTTTGTTTGQGGIVITMLEADSVKATKISDAVKTAFTEINPRSNMTIDVIYGEKNASLFDSLGYLLIGILSFFFVFLLAGISFVRERSGDTLERLMVTPVKIVSVVCGYIAGFGIFAVLQSILVIVFSKFVLKMEFIGPWWAACSVLVLLSFVAVMLGILVSAVSGNEFQVMQFIPVVIIPQIFFSGLIPIDTLSHGLQYLSTIMPLYYGAQALKRILIYGEGFSFGVLSDMGVLFLFLIVLFLLNVVVIKRYRATQS